MYRAITITRGSAGWGGPLTIKPTEKCYKVRLCHNKWLILTRNSV